MTYISSYDYHICSLWGDTSPLKIIFQLKRKFVQALPHSLLQSRSWNLASEFNFLFDFHLMDHIDAHPGLINFELATIILQGYT